MSSSEPPTRHLPVMLVEVLEYLALQPGQIVCDGTMGGGGHARQLIEAVGPHGRLLALDRDPRAVERTGPALVAQGAAAGTNVEVICANYSQLVSVAQQMGIERFNAILLDLGLSSDQLADAERGFSFDASGDLDLRFDPSQGEPAWRLLQRWTEKQLADTIYQFGQERYSRRIARRIVERRRAHQPLRTAHELAELVRSCVPRTPGLRIDPATRTFQALRIAVNGELEALQTALETFPQILAPGGRLAIISFHSLEDRLVKVAFRGDPRYTTLTKKPIRPNEAETQSNPRSRSARLRVAERSQVPGEGT